ncbi:MAG: hypothetical protein PUC34_07970 [Paludibacteraceae bacterium]|nr:hypothetical protein [Paludibacteraceae bacterium]MDD6827128.1 hypothetical protein [Oscillospiraceae bacterium]
MQNYRDLISQIEEWTKVESKPFATRLHTAFEKYQEYISNGISYDGIGESHDLLLDHTLYIRVDDTFLSEIRELCDNILTTYNDYNNGTIAKCIENNWWDKYKDSWSKCHEDADGKDNVYYRMRSRVEGNDTHKIFTREDLFHIPFNRRDLIKPYRYSMIGMPCLYLGCSIYVCWEEMRRASINNLMISAFKLCKGYTLNLLDLRLKREFEAEISLKEYLRTLPLIIACSFKTMSKAGVYIPEYVFPQLVMHLIVKDSAYDRKLDGVIYNTTQQEDDFKVVTKDNFRRIENIAIPVYDVKDEGYCSKLSCMFELTEPTTTEYEDNKDPLRGYLPFPDGDYGNTIFWALEKRLENPELYQRIKV